MNKTVKEIVQEYIIKNDYTGLVNDDYECVCEMNDIMCCANRRFPTSCKSEIGVPKEEQEMKDNE